MDGRWIPDGPLIDYVSAQGVIGPVRTVLICNAEIRGTAAFQEHKGVQKCRLGRFSLQQAVGEYRRAVLNHEGLPATKRRLELAPYTPIHENALRAAMFSLLFQSATSQVAK